ncbi:MAG: pyrroline-5-carboxylate reductase [Propionibacteriaceae bacterium]|jgi:pyrroline-5-carboxylate reductase|nr:pyrroline-5-carboxylate reductase [Propionibacteriaceae bacterium]
MIGLLGAGMMGEALLAGLVAAGWDPAEIRVAESRAARRDEITAKYGVITGTARAAVDGADAVLVVVKPHDVCAVLDEVSPVLDPRTLIISIAAGLTCGTLEAHLPAGQPVVRVMPNTAALVGEGMAVIAGGTAATPAHLVEAERILGAVGKTMVIQEADIDAATAVHGSGPAYLMYVAQAMIDAGVLLGLTRAAATALTAQTFVGSAKLLAESGQHPTVLKENVTSPGGTTAAALRALDDHGVAAAFYDAMERCYRRSLEIGRA